MHNDDAQLKWAEYREHELARLKPVLTKLGYALDQKQPHIRGERYLTGSGVRKLVLLGQDMSGRKVVIKASSEPAAIQELATERRGREVLEHIGFAYQAFLAPQELYWGTRGGLAVLISEFIEQDRPFIERTLMEQFDLALGAFKAQESAHATTASHLRLVQRLFGEMDSGRYLAQAAQYVQEIGAEAKGDVVAGAMELLTHNRMTLDQYGGFLTHWDFIPQNFRIREGRLYLLDHFSIRFGNKYEGWARFINFMELYNPPLARAMVQYVRDNRTPEESLSLKLMRAYRLLELIRYYVSWLPRTTGDLHRLAEARIAFWHEVLAAVLDEREVSSAIVESYKKTRDSLRSEEEKERQQGLH